MRHWNFTTTGHVIPPDLKAECHSPASLLAIPIPPNATQDVPGDTSCVSAEQLHLFQRKHKHEVFEGVTVLADLHDQAQQQSLSLACLGSLVVGSFSHASFHLL